MNPEESCLNRQGLRNGCSLIFRFLAFLLFMGMFGYLPAHAQVDYTTGTLGGTVYDPQAAVVRGATVTVTNADTGVEKVVKTEAGGSQQIPALKNGRSGMGMLYRSILDELSDAGKMRRLYAQLSNCLGNVTPRFQRIIRS